MKTPRGGFTIVEVLIAIIVLTIGVMALASSAGGITRMMSNGQRKTRSMSVAASTLDSLRQKAYSASPKCSGLVSGSSSTSGYGSMISRAWTVSAGPSGTTKDRSVVVITAYRVGPFGKGDTLLATLYPPCP
jgi:prepilin-type N-terminal cleavage/methylation domain-containing protein